MHAYFKVEISEEVFQFLKSIDKKHSKKILYNIRKAQTEQNTQLFKKINEEIWEFRCLYNGIQYRTLAFWDKKTKEETLVIACFIFIKKRSKIPTNEIQKAEQYRIQYFNQNI
ncbi:type II toxin-antitoxin system RelE/ParE family toxin [Aquirufa sp. ROCK2-A2]